MDKITKYDAMSNREMHKKAIEHYGNDAQIEKTIEELDELKIELFRDKKDVKRIMEELADVYNMIEQIMIIYKISNKMLYENMRGKMIRTLENIEGGKTC